MTNDAIRDVPVAIDGERHDGILRLPPQSHSLVLFAHGSGSSRLSRRNNYVADVLAESNIASLLFDLLSEREDQSRANRFDIPLLSERLLGAIAWAGKQPELAALSLGLFGASTGAAAALIAAAAPGSEVAAVVSRGGRPDLAGAALHEVRAPTLLLVGGADRLVLDLNRRALEELQTEKRLVVIPGATHLFEEPGALEQVAQLAAEWFRTYLRNGTD